MHVSLDSALGRQRRLNSVGESVLQIAPSAAAAYSLRSLTGGDPKVVRVRRVIDNAESDFTASGISSGALVDFVNDIQTLGTAVNGTGSFDNYTVSNLSTTGFSADNSAGGTGSAGFPYVFKDEDVIVVKYTVTNFSSTASLSPQIRGVSAINSVTGKTNSGTAFTANGTYTDTLTATADGTHLMYADGNTGSYTISDFEIVSHSSSGFVDTWYDQSGNGNDAINDTDAEQPQIVSSGFLIADGIDFDGSNDVLVAASVSGFGATISLFEASIRDSGAAAVVSMGSSASTTNTNFGLVEAGSNTQASVRNTTSRTVNASVSGETRLGFAVTTGQTSTKVGALGGTLVETTDDYGDDFTSGELDTIFLGKIRGGSSTEFNGHIREALVYDTDQTDNRTAIEANIANHYNITLV